MSNLNSATHHVPIQNVDPFYVASDIRQKRFRRTKLEVTRIRDAIHDILESDNPQTVRQVFYALTVRGVINKAEIEYQRTVVRLLVDMREAGDISFDFIADNTRWMRKPATFTGLESCLNNTSKFYRRDLWAAMPVYVEVWCEKDALAGVLMEETETYDVPLMVARGYASLSFLHSAAMAISAKDKPAYIYHFGDYDPSGVDAARGNGKARSKKLGKYHLKGSENGSGYLSVKEARQKAREYWENPEKYEAQAEVGSFKQVAQEWVKRHVEANRLRSQPEIERIVRTYLYPKWGDVKFLDIRRREVNTLLDHVAEHNGARMADKVLAMLSGVMTWFQSRTEDYVSPIVRGMRRSKNRSRDRTLNDDEIRALWKACAELGQFGRFIQLCLLTAQRRTKVATMRWDDLKDGVWTIRTEPREKGNPGALMLPKLALDILAAQPRIAGNAFVFAGRSGGPFRDLVTAKRTVDRKLPKGMPAWVLHDLRRTARSLMSRAGVPTEHSERVLGHALPGIMGVYDRHKYADEKADALKRLAALIESIVNPPKGNVVAMPKRRRR